MRIGTMLALVAALASNAAVAGGKGGGGHTSSNHPQESVTLNFGKVEHTYKPQTSDGTRVAKPQQKHQGSITHRKAGRDQQ